MAQGQGQGTSSSTGSKPSRDSKTGTYEDPLRRFDQDKGRDDLGSKSVDGAMTTDGDPAIATTQDKGEGSYEGTRRYDEGVRRFGAEKDVQGLAENARKAIDGPEGATLRDAEKRGKQGPALSQGTGGTGTSPARSTDGKTIPVASKPH